MDIFAYIKELGLDTLGFTHVAEYQDYAYLSTEYYRRDNIAVKSELKLSKAEDNLRLYVSHSNAKSDHDWMEIEGTVLERKGKILQYLTSVHYEPAIPLLREYKIDSLTV